MTLMEAVMTRTSQRRYLPDPISAEQRQQLQKTINQCCQRSGLRIQLICDHPAPFDSFIKTYGMLHGVRNYLILAGKREDPHLDEKCGYFGEMIVLTATSMGLGTCWVGGTFQKGSCACQLADDEKLVCVIAIGHTPDTRSRTDALVYRAIQRKTKSVQQLSGGLEKAPDWFSAGVTAVQRAPSAMNRQGVRFVFSEDGQVLGFRESKGPFSLVDLGIAKYHFEVGAHGGRWAFGDGGVFEKAGEEKSCGAVIWQKENSGIMYLLARHNGGHWSFPKGHVEQGETEVDTARREIWEETGLSAKIDTDFRQVVTYYPKPGIVKDVVFFLATIIDGTEKAQEEEIAEIRWFSFEDARDHITFASDEDVLLAANAHLLQMI